MESDEEIKRRVRSALRGDEVDGVKVQSSGQVPPWLQAYVEKIVERQLDDALKKAERVERVSSADWRRPPRNVSEVALVVANLSPIVGVILFEWTVFEVLFLFWLESAIIGGFGILRMIVINPIAALMTVPFFILHYGGFMSIHGALLFAFFGGGAPASGGVLIWRFVQEDAVRGMLQTVRWPAFALIASHFGSFALNFIGDKEYKSASIGGEMDAPYRRILLMHLTLLGGGGICILLEASGGNRSLAPVIGLVVLIGLKIVVDLRAHRREHAQRRKSADNVLPVS